MKQKTAKKSVQEKNYVMPSFDWVSWKPVDMKRVLAREYRAMMKNIAAIKKIPKGKRTFQNTIAALEYASYGFSDMTSQTGFLMYVSPDRKIRETAQKLIDFYTPKLTEITYDIDLYQAVCDCPRDDAMLTHEEKKLWDDVMIGYRRAGLHLPSGKKIKLKIIQNKLQILGNEFEANIRNTDTEIMLAAEELVGLPDTVIKRLKINKDGRYIVPSIGPEYGSFMKYSPLRNRRRELFVLANQKGGKRNIAILKELVGLRDKRVKLLGYKNHIVYQTELTVAKKAARVVEFLKTLQQESVPLLEQDLAPLKNMMERDLGSNAKLEPYDTPYYAELVQKQYFHLDYEKIREYLPLQHVLNTMFGTFGKLLGLSFSLVSRSLWHDTILCYEVSDRITKNPVGVLCLDLFPREGKYSHAALFDVGSGYRDPGTGSVRVPLNAIVGNMTAPHGDVPSLLSLGEAETLYHECGHALHDMLGAQAFRSQSGTQVSRDFVELPSQLAEYWFSDPEFLGKNTKHYLSGKKLPLILQQVIHVQEGFLKASMLAGQLVFSQFDLSIHRGDVRDVVGTYNRILKQIKGSIMPPETYFPAGFGHLCGYDAQYWSYLWSEMIVAEAYALFHKKGMMDKALGKKYRTEILEPGGSRDESAMVRAFLGHDANPDALIRDIKKKISETQKFMRAKKV